MSVPIDHVDLARGVTAAFTGRRPSGGSDVGGDEASGLRDAANLAHHRPHLPSLLAAARREVAAGVGVGVDDLVLMRQVHGGDVATVDDAVPDGAEVRGVDGLVTAAEGRALVVQAADCVPVLAAFDEGPVGVAHAGRAGVEAGIVATLVDELRLLADGRPAADLHVAIGPAIAGCCYEVPDAMAAEVDARVRASFGDVADRLVAQTTWGTTSLDLSATVEGQLRHAGVVDVRTSPGCTRCGGGGRWFSHRRDPASGRHWGILVRDAVGVGEVAA